MNAWHDQRLPDSHSVKGIATPSGTHTKQCYARRASNACVFYTVTQGNIAEPCYATSGDCYTTSQAPQGIGALRGKDFPNQDAYPAVNGYSLATGLGSVNVANLLTVY